MGKVRGHPCPHLAPTHPELKANPGRGTYVTAAGCCRFAGLRPHQGLRSRGLKLIRSISWGEGCLWSVRSLTPGGRGLTAPHSTTEAAPGPCTGPQLLRCPGGISAPSLSPRVSLAQGGGHPSSRRQCLRLPPACRLPPRGTHFQVKTPQHSEEPGGAGPPLTPPCCLLTHPPPAFQVHPRTHRGPSPWAGSSPSRGHRLWAPVARPRRERVYSPEPVPSRLRPVPTAAPCTLIPRPQRLPGPRQRRCHVSSARFRVQVTVSVGF